MTNFYYKPITNKNNFGGRRDKSNIKFIALHWTSNTSDTATAMNHYKYFQNNNVGASAHYFVDDNDIVQIVGDSTIAYAVGGNQGYGVGLGGITNYNSISIEMCVNHGYSDKMLFNTIELVKELLMQYPNAKVVRHWDATRKNCPQGFTGTNNGRWNKFLSDVKQPRRLILDLSKDSVAVEVNSQKTSVSTKKGWVQENGKWYYYIDGKKKIGWLKSGTKWFYMKPNEGEMCVGWLQYNKHWFYFNKSGYMVTGEQTIDDKNYKFNNDGYLL